MTDPERIDLSLKPALGDLSTDEGRLALVEIFRVYFENVATACAEMRRAQSSEDVRRHAHRARGASGVVGAAGLVREFADLEARAAAGEAISGETYDEIDRRLTSLRQEVTAQIGQELK